MELKEWIKLNFREPLTSEKLSELDEIIKEVKLQNCPHKKFYFDIDKMDFVCEYCKKTKFSIRL